MYLAALLGLISLGGAGVWFGLVEGFKIGVLVGVLALAALVLFAFNGGAGRFVPPMADQRRATPGMASAGGRSVRTRDQAFTDQLSVMVVVGLLVGAVAVWFGLVEGFKIAFLIGGLALAGAVLAAVRGKAAF